MNTFGQDKAAKYRSVNDLQFFSLSQDWRRRATPLKAWVNDRDERSVSRQEESIERDSASWEDVSSKRIEESIERKVMEESVIWEVMFQEQAIRESGSKEKQ